MSCQGDYVSFYAEADQAAVALTLRDANNETRTLLPNERLILDAVHVVVDDTASSLVTNVAATAIADTIVAFAPAPASGSAMAEFTFPGEGFSCLRGTLPALVSVGEASVTGVGRVIFDGPVPGGRQPYQNSLVPGQ
jgi:hypothetical protein